MMLQQLGLTLAIAMTCTAHLLHLNKRDVEISIAPQYSDFLLFLPKSTLRVGVQLNIPIEHPVHNIYRGLLVRADYNLPTFNVSAKPEGRGRLAGVHRWSLYAIMEQALERVGMSGQACLVRAVCEAAFATFDHDGLLGQLLHVLLTPSSSVERSTQNWQRNYERAEHWGSAGHQCDSQYAAQCPEGALEHFTTLAASAAVVDK